jgi:hypothetical protein
VLDGNPEPEIINTFIKYFDVYCDCLCDLVVKVLGYRSKDQASIPGATSFSEK